MKIKIIFLLTIAFFTNTQFVSAAEVSLSRYTGQSVTAGDSLVLKGSGFTRVEDIEIVMVLQVSNEATYVTPKRIKSSKIDLTIPSTLKPGKYLVALNYEGGCEDGCSSNSISLTISPPVPVIDLVEAKASEPNQIYSGEKAYIHGEGFTDSLTVKLGVSEPDYIKAIVISDEYAEFIVPSTGYDGVVAKSITVINAYGKSSDGLNGVEIIDRNAKEIIIASDKQTALEQEAKRVELLNQINSLLDRIRQLQEQSGLKNKKR